MGTPHLLVPHSHLCPNRVHVSVRTAKQIMAEGLFFIGLSIELIKEGPCDFLLASRAAVPSRTTCIPKQSLPLSLYAALFLSAQTEGMEKREAGRGREDATRQDLAQIILCAVHRNSQSRFGTILSDARRRRMRT
jgi:hypothetical protein